MISSPRFLVIGLAALFSAYHLVLALSSISVPRDPAPVVVAMVLYAAATAVSLWAPTAKPMAGWNAALNVAVGPVLSILVLSQLDPHAANGYATWFVAGVFTLLVITMVRGQPVFAWIGVGVTVVAIVVWADPLALILTGVFGGAMWVAIAHALSIALVRAEQDAAQYARAGIKAAEWQANQEALLYERRHRLEQMDKLAAPMLRRIVASGGDLGADERRECLHLEAAIRDEIRGRLLLTDDVRAEVMAARRRGVHVTMLDDGGLDALPEMDRLAALAELVDVVGGIEADRLIIRTGTENSDTAVSVVGLRETGDDGTAAALGDDDGDDEVTLWHEIRRP
ncbi:hypothetical protein ITJ38_02590 [Agreia pratensis]|uniref:Signal transduction histidine kinase n=1 Tax=Agreia pratensis TaxID=150121 RepID=A0A1X7IDI2_9MICO|nr:hypothetical protein [Agreia pratensis]MBF4633285.1 hypothetical protein [Agreia pratensis]SMG12755.1 hypothetical protein SAMN06296010_0411 [Agreia pratensis]